MDGVRRNQFSALDAIHNFIFFGKFIGDPEIRFESLLQVK
jgi:hypothetical protein